MTTFWTKYMCQYLDTHNVVCHINKFLFLFGHKDYIYSIIKFGDENKLKFGTLTYLISLKS